MHPQHIQYSRVLHLPHVTAMTGQVQVSKSLVVLTAQNHGMQGLSCLHFDLLSNKCCLSVVNDNGHGRLQAVQGYIN